MPTVKLYDADSHQKEFEATVISSEKCGELYRVLLDKTAFFPEAGGQPCDTGTIDGAAVKDVKEEGENIVHFTDSPLQIGKTVTGLIDFERRFLFMQNHSGEHIVSGIVHKKYGYDNVGFHLNEQFVTLDFNGVLTREQLDEIEDEANAAVFKNLPVRAYYPTEKELLSLDYRSKKEIEGAVRLVEIEGIDLCACCAPHVSFTGEIGLIKLLDISRMRGGTRIVLKCGGYALCDYRVKFSNILKISDLLSAKQEETADAVENLLVKSDDIKRKNSELKRSLAEGIIKAAKPDEIFFFEEDFDMKELQILADGLHKTYGGNKAVISGTEEKISFVLCGEENEISELFNSFKQSFAVRGGGRSGMFQGTVEASPEALKQFFKKEV